MSSGNAGLGSDGVCVSKCAMCNPACELGLLIEIETMGARSAWCSRSCCRPSCQLVVVVVGDDDDDVVVVRPLDDDT